MFPVIRTPPHLHDKGKVAAQKQLIEGLRI